MADDIEIDENDLFDNPLIKKKYLDTTKLKKEVDDVPIIKTEPAENFSSRLVFDESQSLESLLDEIKRRKINKLRNSAKPCLHKLPEPQILPNKIIIGSKVTGSAAKVLKVTKAKMQNRTKKTEIKIVLKDIRLFMENKKSYCEICMILFPTKHKLDIHKKHYHDLIYDNILIYENKMISSQNGSQELNYTSHLDNSEISFNKDVKAYAGPRSKQKRQLQTYNHKSSKSLICLHCPQIFPNCKSLIDHLYSVLDCEKNISKEQCDIEDCNQTNEVTKINKKGKVNDVHHDSQIVIKPDNIFENKINNQDGLKDKKVKSNEQIISDRNNRDYKDIKVTNIKMQKELPYPNNKNVFKKLFRCLICSYYMRDRKSYITHLAKKHRVKDIISYKKVPFDPFCRICCISLSNEHNYNKHLRNQHLKEYTRVDHKKSKNVSEMDIKVPKICNSPRGHTDSFEKSKSEFHKFALKSLLFKCCKCDVHFFSVEEAIQHSNHKEILTNWKCPICQLLFKKESESLHMKQHDISKNINIFDVLDRDVNKYLYVCTQCAVYFEESYYMHHYICCGSTPSDSEYCIECDILIDKKTMAHHKNLHTFKKMKCADFIYVNSEDILDNSENLITNTKGQESCTKRKMYDSVNKRQTSDEESWIREMLVLSYCQSCQSYDIASRRYIHVQSLCLRISKRACKRCGLVFNKLALFAHRRLHRLKSDLQPKDFTILDLKGRQINPPIPEYPQCRKCKIHFISKIAATNHTCGDVDYLTCQECELKLSHVAFKRHKLFHDCSMKKLDLFQIKGKNNNHTNINPIEQSVKPNSNNEKALDHSFTIIYTCKSCSLSLFDYDKVVEHCQEHFTRNELTNISKICNRCSLMLTTEFYDLHLKYCPINKSEFTIITFDKYYFAAENKIWLEHMFKSLPSEEVHSITSKSLYEFEHRIKLTLNQTGYSNITIYKCDQCQCSLDPSCLKIHIEDDCKKNNHKYPCSICGLSFNSLLYQETHEKLHDYQEISMEALRIVIFNRNEDKALNQIMSQSSKLLHVIYQCRNCKVVVKKCKRETHLCQNDNAEHCDVCGLLVLKDDYGAHINNHANLANFNYAFMKVVLFGKRNTTVCYNNRLKPTYVGFICDYTLYQCNHCEICFETEQIITSHICSFTQYKCSVCQLFFSTSNKLDKHVDLHEKDSEYLIENINIMRIDINVSKNGLNFSSFGTDKIITSFGSCSMKVSATNIQRVKMYKCTCDLHFLDESEAVKHFTSCNPKIRKQKHICLKCDKYFTSTELFNHLIIHHANKDVVFQFVIEELGKRCYAQNE